MDFSFFKSLLDRNHIKITRQQIEKNVQSKDAVVTNLRTLQKMLYRLLPSLCGVQRIHTYDEQGLKSGAVYIRKEKIQALRQFSTYFETGGHRKDWVYALIKAIAIDSLHANPNQWLDYEIAWIGKDFQRSHPQLDRLLYDNPSKHAHLLNRYSIHLIERGLARDAWPIIQKALKLDATNTSGLELLCRLYRSNEAYAVEEDRKMIRRCLYTHYDKLDPIIHRHPNLYLKPLYEIEKDATAPKAFPDPNEIKLNIDYWKMLLKLDAESRACSEAFVLEESDRIRIREKIRGVCGFFRLHQLNQEVDAFIAELPLQYKDVIKWVPLTA